MARINPALGDDLVAALADLETQGSPVLRASWQRLYRTSPPDHISRDLLVRAIAHRMQETALGGLRPAAKRKLAAWASSLAEPDGQPSPTAAIRLKPGATLVRTWHGVTHNVRVAEDGFEYQGTHYASLSHIAQVITGAHWSGPRFFGLIAKSQSPTDAESEVQNATVS